MTNKLIPLSEVKKHRSEGDAWIIVKNMVFDISKYADVHPGGEIILEYAGTDATDTFNEYHSWVNPKNLILQHLLGTVDPNN